MVYLLLDRKGKNTIKITKYIVIKNIKDTKTTLLKQIIFMLKRKMFLENINNLVTPKISLPLLIKKELFKILNSNNSSKDDFSLKWLDLFKIIPCKKIKSVKTLIKSRENDKSTLSFKEPFKNLNKEIYKNLTVNDLQHEINIIKQEISELKHRNKNINPELMMLKDGQTDKKHDEHQDGDEPSQQALLSDKGITDAFTGSRLALVRSEEHTSELPVT